MLNRRIRHAAHAVLVGAALSVLAPSLAGADVAPGQEATWCTTGPVDDSGCPPVSETADTPVTTPPATAPDLPAMAARRRSRVPTSAPPLVVAEPDGGGTTPDVVVPVSETPTDEARAPQPLRPQMPEPTPVVEADVGPDTAPPEPSPPGTVPADHPIPPPSGRLPTTGGTAVGAALAGAFLSLGGICIGAGRQTRRGS